MDKDERIISQVAALLERPELSQKFANEIANLLNCGANPAYLTPLLSDRRFNENLIYICSEVIKPPATLREFYKKMSKSKNLRAAYLANQCLTRLL
jgi:hypothetical protein